MLALVAAIHAFNAMKIPKAWMAGTSPAMTASWMRVICARAFCRLPVFSAE
jgi:hypothetical protein